MEKQEVATTSKSAHIPLVEDNRMDVEDAFKEACLGNTIYASWNGQEALDYLFDEGNYKDRQTYPLRDLIFLDLKLPRIDGHEVLRQIKKTPILKQIKVVILASSNKKAIGR